MNRLFVLLQVGLVLLLIQASPIFLSAQSTAGLCKGNLGANIFPRGEFGSGTANVLPYDPKLAPSYIYQSSPPPNDGYYTITNGTHNWGSFARDTWIKIGDNSNDPEGYFMVVNATVTPGLFFIDTVSVCDNTTYIFSADVIAMNIPAVAQNYIRPNISFLVDGKEVYATGTVPIDAQWHTYGFVLTVPPGQTQLVLALRNNAPGGTGNDLGLDNISFKPCGPKIDIPDTTFFCAFKPLDLGAKVENSVFKAPAYQWQESGDGGLSWLDITGGNQPTLLIQQPRSGISYRLLVGDGPDQLANPSCRVISDVSTVYKPDIRDTVEAAICPGGSLTIGGKTLTEEGSYDITFQTRDGCDSIVTYQLRVEDLSTFAIQGNDYLCRGQATTLNAGSFASYKWSTGATSASIEVRNAGTYSVSVTSANKCTGSASITLSERQLRISPEGTDPACAGGNDGSIAVLNIQDGQRPFQYSLNGQAFQGASLFTGLSAGAYRVGVRDALGCTDSVTLILQNPPPFQINLGAKRSIKLGERASLLAISNQPIVQYAWEPASSLNCTDCAEPEAAPDSTTTYTLRATNEQGCTVSAQTTIEVMPVRFVYAPNVFSPNGDGRNDYFTLYTGQGVLRILSFSIFDRWGNIVFWAGENLPDSEALRWDGRKNGQPLPAGAYAWQAEIAFSDGKQEIMKGEVTLVR